MANPDGQFWVAKNEAELEACKRENLAILHGRPAVKGWDIRDTYPGTDLAYREAEALRKAEGVETKVLSPDVNASGNVMYRHAVVLSRTRTW